MFKSIDGGILPHAKTRAAAGYDVCANEDVILYPGARKSVKLGIAIDPEAINRLEADFCGEFAENFYFMLTVRSSVGGRGVYMPNAPGIIDMDYFDEIKMMLALPDSEENPFRISKGMRLGQLILMRHFGREILKDEYREDTRRIGGFGSTGV
jgi:dUTP pyrophosphatase